MDADRLKNRIREALGGAGLPRDIGEMVERIIDEEAGEKEEDKPVAVAHHDEDEDEDDDAEHRAAMARAAQTRAKPARKIKTARKKK